MSTIYDVLYIGATFCLPCFDLYRLSLSSYQPFSNKNNCLLMHNYLFRAPVQIAKFKVRLMFLLIILTHWPWWSPVIVKVSDLLLTIHPINCTSKYFNKTVLVKNAEFLDRFISILTVIRVRYFYINSKQLVQASRSFSKSVRINVLQSE